VNLWAYAAALLFCDPNAWAAACRVWMRLGAYGGHGLGPFGSCAAPFPAAVPPTATCQKTKSKPGRLKA
jgi:hypothetical protein